MLMIFRCVRYFLYAMLASYVLPVYAACENFRPMGAVWEFDLSGGLNAQYGLKKNDISIDLWAKDEKNFGLLGENYYVLAKAEFNAAGTEVSDAYCDTPLNWGSSSTASSEYYYVLFNKDVYGRRQPGSKPALSYPGVTSSTEANGYAEYGVNAYRRCTTVGATGCTLEARNIALGKVAVDGRFAYGVAMYFDRERSYSSSLKTGVPFLPPKAYLYGSQINTPGMTGGTLGAYNVITLQGSDEFADLGKTIGPYGSSIYYPIGDPKRGVLGTAPLYHRIAACNQSFTSCAYGGVSPNADATYEKKKYVFLFIVYKISPYTTTNTYGRIAGSEKTTTPFDLFNTIENQQKNAPIVGIETSLVQGGNQVVRSLAMCVAPSNGYTGPFSSSYQSNFRSNEVTQTLRYAVDKTLISTRSDFDKWCSASSNEKPTPAPTCEMDITTTDGNAFAISDGTNGTVILPSKKWADFSSYAGSSTYRYTKGATPLKLSFQCTGSLGASFTFKTENNNLASIPTSVKSTVTNGDVRGVIYNSNQQQVNNQLNAHVQLYVLNKGATCSTLTSQGDIANASVIPLACSTVRPLWSSQLISDTFSITGNTYSTDLCARYYTEAQDENALGEGRVTSVLKYVLSYQ